MNDLSNVEVVIKINVKLNKSRITMIRVSFKVRDTAPLKLHVSHCLQQLRFRCESCCKSLILALVSPAMGHCVTRAALELAHVHQFGSFY